MKEGSLDFSEEDSPGNLLGRNPIMSDFTLGSLFSPSGSKAFQYDLTFAKYSGRLRSMEIDGCKHFLTILKPPSCHQNSSDAKQKRQFDEL